MWKSWGTYSRRLVLYTNCTPSGCVVVGNMAVRVLESSCVCLVSQIEYPEIEEGSKPRYRFMSAFEQRMETVDKNNM